MGEIAACVPILDAGGIIASLKQRTSPFPRPLRQALIKRFQWEAGFAIDNAQAALGRRDQMHVAGCAYRALSGAAQVLFALNERYLINEKGALIEAARFPRTIAGLDSRPAAVWAAIGALDLTSAIAMLRRISADLDALIDSGT
jgi:hypothetical protein